MPENGPARWKHWPLAFLVFVPIIFNAIYLYPEISLPVPSLNDDAVHYLLIQRASEALAHGENLVDHWMPELELGFPFFFYYQHLPHLFVVALHRALFQQFDLLTVFNLVRYLLLVGFPLTVYWSMRRMEFSIVAAAAGAAAASLFSSNHRYGLEYDSYVWRGLGVFTQLWAMHLYFIVLANLDRLIERGRGYFAAVLSCSILGLSHLLYAYMLAITALTLLVCGMKRANWSARVGRLALVGGLTLVVCSYMWLPYIAESAYFGWSPYLQRWKYDSFGAAEILKWLANGDLLDYDRLPVLTVLLALGIAAALRRRDRPARVALALFSVWLLLYFGRPTWGRLMDLLPLHSGLLIHRFVGSLDVAAILLIGLGGEWLWQQAKNLAPALKFDLHALTATVVLLVLLIPALRERRRFYSLNTQWIERTRSALAADTDAADVIAAVKELPPGRVYAGLRANWGKALVFGDLHFYDLLTFNRIAAVSPPYSGISLNADLIWHFDDRSAAHYDLFNVKYVIAPRGWPAAEFLKPVKQTLRYTLYRAETSGYADFADVIERRSPASQAALFFQNRDWFQAGGPALKRAVRYDYPAARRPRASAADESRPGCAAGKIYERSVTAGRVELEAQCASVSTVAIKITYHPNWRVAVDGRETQIFMISPSFIGFDLPPGNHRIVAEYRASAFKLPLLIIGFCALAALFASRRRLDQPI
ncbi:MAG TPA: YfhO family protein [Verrucomicrobiae bacterium]|nr:YfhO family protein [Verrucomicrobiae bacterium]